MITFKEYVIKEGIEEDLIRDFHVALREVAKRAYFGAHRELTIRPSYVLHWSSGAHRWDVHKGHGRIRPHTSVVLDANQVLIPSNKSKDAQIIADNLPPLPLDVYSFQQNPIIGAFGHLPLNDPFRSIAPKPQTFDIEEELTKFANKIRNLPQP